jgi:hypothetical protein
MSKAGARQGTIAAPSMRALIFALGWLAIVIAPAALAVAYLQATALSANGAAGASPSNVLRIAAASGMICGGAGALALVVSWLGNSFGMPVQGVLLSMLFRLGIPLASVMAGPQLDRSLGTLGIANAILGVYLIALVAETVLSLRMVPQVSRGAPPLALHAAPSSHQS